MRSLVQPVQFPAYPRLQLDRIVEGPLPNYGACMTKALLVTIMLLVAACAPRTALPPASPLECAQGGKYTCQEAKDQAHQLRAVPSESPTLR